MKGFTIIFEVMSASINWIYLYYSLFIFFVILIFAIYIFFKNDYKKNYSLTIYITKDITEINSNFINLYFLKNIKFGNSNKIVQKNTKWFKLKNIKLSLDEKYIYVETYLKDYKRIHKINQIKNSIKLSKKYLLLEFKFQKNLPIIIRFRNSKELVIFINKLNIK